MINGSIKIIEEDYKAIWDIIEQIEELSEEKPLHVRIVRDTYGDTCAIAYSYENPITDEEAQEVFDTESNAKFERESAVKFHWFDFPNNAQALQSFQNVIEFVNKPVYFRIVKDNPYDNVCIVYSFEKPITDEEAQDAFDRRYR